MQRLITLLKRLHTELSSFTFVRHVFLISLVYGIIAIYLVDFRAIINIIENRYSFVSTFTILILLFPESLQTLSLLNIVLLILISFIFGLNTQLIVTRIDLLTHAKNLKITMGAGIISIIANGCSACGLSLLSILGLTGAITILPFRGIELSLLGLTLLSITLFYNLDSIDKACAIPQVTM